MNMLLKTAGRILTITKLIKKINHMVVTVTKLTNPMEKVRQAIISITTLELDLRKEQANGTIGQFADL